MRQTLLDVPIFKQISATTYQYQGYEFHLMLRDYANELTQKLKLANELQIESAPKLIEHIKVGTRESVVITHQPGCERERPLPYRSYRQSIPIEAKDKFLADMEKLADKGYRHRYATKGLEHWFIHPTTQHILLNAWESLESVDKRTADESVSNIKKLLKRR